MITTLDGEIIDEIRWVAPRSSIQATPLTLNSGRAEMNLKRRLAKLERHLTDASGLVPHSRAWMEQWIRECEKAVTEDDYQPARPIPLEAVSEYLQDSK